MSKTDSRDKHQPSFGLVSDCVEQSLVESRNNVKLGKWSGVKTLARVSALPVALQCIHNVLRVLLLRLMPVELVVSSSEMPWITEFLLAKAECWQISQFCSSVFCVVVCRTVTLGPSVHCCGREADPCTWETYTHTYFSGPLASCLPGRLALCSSGSS